MDTAQPEVNIASVPDTKPQPKVNANPLHTLVLSTILTLILSGLVLFSSGSRNSSLKKEMDNLKKTNSELQVKVKEQENTIKNLNEDLSKYTKAGSTIPKVVIKTIPLSEKWVISTTKVSYEIKNVYLTPSILDLPESEKTDYSSKYFLMFELVVKDARTTGARIKTPVATYIKLQDGKTVLNPFIEDYLWLSPGETKTYYTGIAVDLTQKVFNVLVGPGKKPKTVKVDFGSSTIDAREGVFLLKEGYKEEYIN